MSENTQILSRHRLPQPYRGALVALWVLPAGLLYLALIAAHGLTPALINPVLLLALAGMGLPALYVWQEGVDVTQRGLVIRSGGWRRRGYHELDSWYVDTRPPHRIFMVWDANQQRVISCHTAHLTDFATLTRALKQRVRWRGWHA